MSKKVHAAILARDAAQFLAFKRAMGMGYRRAEFVLASFVRFVREPYGDSPVSLEQVVTRWATRIEGRKAVTVANEFGVVRQLCLFRRRSDPRAFVPDHAVAPVKESVFVPYIFNREGGARLARRGHAARRPQHVGRGVALAHAGAVLHRHAAGRGNQTSPRRRRSASRRPDRAAQQGPIASSGDSR